MGSITAVKRPPLPWLAVSFLALGCNDQRFAIEKPTPPDMTAVVSRYEQPDGIFDQAHAQAILDSYAARATSVANAGLTQEVVDALRSGIDEALASSETQHVSGGLAQTEQRLELDVNGTMFIERICAGWAVEPAPDRANGTLTGRINFSEDGIDPVVWGDAQACQYLVLGTQVSVDDDSEETGERTGDLRLWLGKGATFETFGTTPLLFDVDLRVDIAGVGSTLDFSFRFDPATKVLGIAQDASPGFVVVSNTDTAALAVTAANGNFNCDPQAQLCTSDTGQSFSF